MFKWVRLILVVMASVCLITTVALSKAYASGSCSAFFSTSVISPSSQAGNYLQVNNQGSDPIQWVKVTEPSSGDFAILDTNGGDWAGNAADPTITYTGGSMAPGDAYNRFFFDFQSGPNKTGPQIWTVEASSDPSGANPFACDDQGLEVAIDDGVPPSIADVTISGLSSTSATITWTTDVAASSVVDYGRTNQYGSQASVAGAQPNHTVVITNLSAGKAYHFRVDSADAAGNVGSSGDNTFLTPESTSLGGNQGIAGSGVKPIGIIVTNPGDKTPPVITFTKLPSGKIFKTAPTYTGVATDDVAVQRVEYSTDDGKDWLPADQASTLNTKQVAFSFTPQNLDDGNYQILARAIDAGANITATVPFSLVIDRLPPLVGGIVTSLGTQLLQPDNNGVVTVPSTVDLGVTLTAVGGPTTITLTARKIGNPAQKLSDFQLTRSADNGLWRGVIGFPAAGSYQLTVNAADGAGNHTTRQLNTIQVESAGRITDAQTKKPVQANVTVYYRDPDTNTWVEWDAETYNQSNPLKTSSTGTYSFFLPSGMYYLKVTREHYKPIVSQSFILNKLSVVSSAFVLHHELGLHIGPFHLAVPTFQETSLSSNSGSGTTSKAVKPVALNKPVPNFTLSLTNGHTLKSVQLLGKPSIMTFISTWAPPAQDELGILNQLNRDGLNIVPVGTGENSAKLAVYNAVAGYDIPLLSDSDQQLAGPFGVTSLPTSYFIDRHGIVKRVMVGVLSKEELLKNVQY